MIEFIVEDQKGNRRTIEVPEDINLSLMEVLKASEYNIPATCGGMALCATCHVGVVENLSKLPPVTEAELDMLDTLPDATESSRLACQLKIGKHMNGVIFKIQASDAD